MEQLSKSMKQLRKNSERIVRSGQLRRTGGCVVRHRGNTANTELTEREAFSKSHRANTEQGRQTEQQQVTTRRPVGCEGACERAQPNRKWSTATNRRCVVRERGNKEQIQSKADRATANPREQGRQSKSRLSMDTEQRRQSKSRERKLA